MLRLSAITLAASLTLCVAPLQSQLRGGIPAVNRAPSSWWVSAGANLIGLGPVIDGATGSTWEFSGDSRWLMRGSIEKTTKPGTTIGIAVSHGTVGLQYSVNSPNIQSPSACQTPSCSAKTDIWTTHAVLRSGGNPNDGIYQFIEVAAGMIEYRNMRMADSSKLSLDAAGTRDLNTSLGYGLGYAFSKNVHVAFIQDFGISWHSGDNLPEGSSRTHRSRSSRITLRYGLGSIF